MNQQCLGITKSGERCKITGNLTDGYCYRHRKQESAPPVASLPEPPAAAPTPPPKIETPAPPPSAPPVEADASPSNAIIIAGFLCVLLLLILMIANRKRQAEFIRLR